MKRLFLCVLAGVALSLCSCVTTASNNAYEAKLRDREYALKQELERQKQIEKEICAMNEQYEELSKPVTGSQAVDVAVGVGIAALFAALGDALFGN